MKVEKTASGRFRVSEGDFWFDLPQAAYEDLYYALPLDPATLFLLLNETVLTRKEDRELLRKMVAVHGNIQQAMPVLGREVAKCDPKAVTEVPVEAPLPRAIADGSPRSSLAGLVDEVVTGKVTPPRPAVPPIGSARPGVPSPKPPGKGKTRKTRKSKIRAAQQKAGSVDDDIPVAEVVTPSVPPSRPPTSYVTPPPQPVPTAPVIAKGEPPAPARKSQLGVMRTPDIEFWITDGDLVIHLSQKRYEELHRALPLDNQTLYRFVNDSILSGPEERERFQELVRRSGGVDAALTLLQQQIKMLPPDPTGSYPATRPSTTQQPAVPRQGPTTAAAPPPRPAAPVSRPAVPAAPSASPAAQKQQKSGARILELEVESQTGEKYRIIYGNLMLTLGKAQYQELYYSLPSDNVSLFRLLFTKILTDAESRNTLKKMVEKAGSNKLFFDSLQVRVREVTPTQSWD